jgi:hypothetical protein
MTTESSTLSAIIDPESERIIGLLSAREKIRSNRVPGVRTVLVVLSARAIICDIDALRQKVTVAYPDAAVFYYTATGAPIGMPAPRHVDLLIDLTAPRQREPLLFSKRLRRMARVAVGRKSGWFRAKLYDRVFDENAGAGKLSKEPLENERQVQALVLELAGISDS